MVASASKLDPDNTNILVCGGGGVALETVRILKSMGSWVWMLQRTDARQKQIEKWFAVWAKGDALDLASVEKVFKGIDGGEVQAVVSTLGGTLEDNQVDSVGNINVIETAKKFGVKKFILVTSIGCGNSRSALSAQAATTLGPVLDQKDKAEARLREICKDNGMEFVIIRPGGLKSESATKNGVLVDNEAIIGSITREDTAKLVVDALFSDKTSGKTLHAVDKNMLMGEMPYEPFPLK